MEAQRKRYDKLVIPNQIRQGDILLTPVEKDAMLLPTITSGGNGRAPVNKHTLSRKEDREIFPKAGKNAGRAIIAFGEETGHHHSFPDPGAIELFGPFGGDTRYALGAPTRIDVMSDTSLEHNTHGPANLNRGWSYDINRQRGGHGDRRGHGGGSGGFFGDIPRGYVD